MYTGVLSAFQRVDYLLRAFALTLKAQPHAPLLMVSPLVSESDEAQHKRLAQELEISNSVIWIVPHALEDLPSYLALADVTVGPRPECPGHPIKLLNYMFAGKPIVSFAGRAKGVRHLQDAFIVPTHNYEALGRGTVARLKDRKLASELGANAHLTVQSDFDWRQICRKIARIYEHLLGASPNTVRTLPPEPAATRAAVEH